MKSTTLIQLCAGLALFSGGYYWAEYNDALPRDHQSSIAEAPFAKKTFVDARIDLLKHKEAPITHYEDHSEDQLERLLKHDQAEVRKLALIEVWQRDLVSSLVDEIKTIQIQDNNSRVRDLAARVLEGAELAGESYTIETPVISDYESPDEQIQSVLAAQPNTFAQAVEQPEYAPDYLDSVDGLTEQQQLEQIEEMAQSQDDAAIHALNYLLLNSNPSVQTAAIDALISILEERTGHFELIAEHLQQNVVFLDEGQTVQLKILTEVEL